MKRSDMRVSQPRWCSLGGAALAVAAVAVIGFTTVTPAKADWDRHSSFGFGLSFGGPAYGYYPYPAYGYGYSPYYGYPAYYPAYSYGYPYAYGGPSIGFSYSNRR
jgi:hypothetical protein